MTYRLLHYCTRFHFQNPKSLGQAGPLSLSGPDFQTYIQSLLSGTATNNRATYSQILFALYNAVKLLNSKAQSAEAQLSNVNSQFSTYSQSANYANELNRNRVNEKVNTLYKLVNHNVRIIMVDSENYLYEVKKEFNKLSLEKIGW